MDDPTAPAETGEMNAPDISADGNGNAHVASLFEIPQPSVEPEPAKDAAVPPPDGDTDPAPVVQAEGELDYAKMREAMGLPAPETPVAAPNAEEVAAAAKMLGMSAERIAAFAAWEQGQTAAPDTTPTTQAETEPLSDDEFAELFSNPQKFADAVKRLTANGGAPLTQADVDAAAERIFEERFPRMYNQVARATEGDTAYRDLLSDDPVLAKADAVLGQFPEILAAENALSQYPHMAENKAFRAAHPQIAAFDALMKSNPDAREAYTNMTMFKMGVAKHNSESLPPREIVRRAHQEWKEAIPKVAAIRKTVEQGNRVDVRPQGSAPAVSSAPRDGRGKPTVTTGPSGGDVIARMFELGRR